MGEIPEYLTSKWTILGSGMVLERRRSGKYRFPGDIFNDNGHYELKLEVFRKNVRMRENRGLTEVNVLRTGQQASFFCR